MAAGAQRAGVPVRASFLIVAIFLVFGLLTNRAGHIEHGIARTTFPIVAFEVAGSGEKAEQILSESVELVASGDTDIAEARELVETAVRRSLWWDFGFILGYSLLIFTLAPALGRKLGGTAGEWAGTAIGWSGLLAGLLDVIENASLFRVLGNASRGAWAFVAALASWGKWTLIAGALAHGVIGLARLGARSIRRPAARGG